MSAIVQKKSIFVIEDNEADALLIESALSAKDYPQYDVTRFRDGFDAISLLLNRDRQIPDVILLDLNMPRSDGLDILRQIRETPRLTHIPVGILTGSRASVDESRATLIGATRFVHKPVVYDEFVDGVRRAVEQMLNQQFVKRANQ